VHTLAKRAPSARKKFTAQYQAADLKKKNKLAQHLLSEI